MAAFLELRNVSKSFGQGAQRVDVLQNINLTIEEGEFIAIVGFTGSGKTTLINLIAGLIEPDEGEILLNRITSYNVCYTKLLRAISTLPATLSHGSSE